ncbi:MAG: hypothetical protein R3B70_49310 [Polyangiaceae bacterium]
MATISAQITADSLNPDPVIVSPGDRIELSLAPSRTVLAEVRWSPQALSGQSQPLTVTLLATTSLDVDASAPAGDYGVDISDVAGELGVIKGTIRVGS